MTTTAVTTSEGQQFSTREVPWMKLGKLVDKPVSAEQAAKMSGLDFDVELRPAMYPDRDGKIVESTHRRWVVRVDTDEPFEVVSADYTICQYREAFQLLDEISPSYVAAGGLKSGKQGFMVIEAPAKYKIKVADDPHDLYIVARTSHDRSRALEIAVMPLRQRCMNQLTMKGFALGVDNRWSIVHTGNMQDRIDDAKMSLKKLGTYVEAYNETAQKLIETKVSNQTAQKLISRIMPKWLKSESREERVADILSLWKNGETVGYAGTGWGLVNAVSEYYEWSRTGGSITSESRFLAALQGDTKKNVDRVASLILTRG